METAVVAIGRGVNGRQMAEGKWQHFILDLAQLIEKLGGKIHTRAVGIGHWDGYIEDSCLVSFGDADLHTLAHELGRLAYAYNQECIALIIGTCELVPAWTS